MRAPSRKHPPRTVGRTASRPARSHVARSPPVATLKQVLDDGAGQRRAPAKAAGRRR